MKDYQQKKMKAYVLPQPVYRQALWAVKDLQRLKQRLAELRAEAYVLGGHDISMPSLRFGTGLVCDSTGSSAVKLALIAEKIEAIEGALAYVPDKYRGGIKNKLVHNMPYDEELAHSNTWKRWQQIFLYHVAENLKIF